MLRQLKTTTRAFAAAFTMLAISGASSAAEQPRIPKQFFGTLVMPVNAQVKLADMPDGPGRETTKRICQGCHAITIVTAQRHTREQWNQLVDNMISRGAQGTDDEFAEIVEYLTANFGPIQPSPDAAPPAAPPTPPAK